MKTYNYIVLLLIVLCASLNTFAQRYPVQATLTLTSPYPVRLSEYTQIDSDKAQATIWLKDVSQADIPVKLRLRIENTQKRLILETSPSFVGEPIHLVGGQTAFLDGTDLGPYFELNNLTTLSGNKSSIVSNGGKLPDGYYKFSLEVLDFYTGRKISNTSYFQCFLVLSDPPILSLPIDGKTVEATDPQFINFSWVPRHLASPNRPQNVTYRFQVVEILRDNQTAGDAFATTPPIIDEENVMAPAYQITAIDTPLEPGNKYAWRVQAYDEDELGLMKNNGWSEPRLFTFGVACTACQQFAIANTTHARAELIWEGAFEHTSWEVRYRRKAGDEDEGELPWKTKEFFTDQGVVKPLQDSTYYQFQVRGNCAGGRFGEWSPLQEALTEKAPESTYSCDGGVVTIAWENSDPLLTPMEVGEQFTAGDFDVTVVEDEVANGQHSGIGMIRIAAFNKVFFNVEWDEITLNTDNRLIDGEALVTGSDTDIIPPELAAAIMAGLDVLDQVLAGAEFVANVIENLPPDIKEDFTSSKEAVETSKDKLKEEKKLLKEAKKHLKNLEEEDEGYSEAVAAVKAMETTVETTRQTLSTAKKKKSQAINNAISYVTKELQKGIKYFVKFTTGVVAVLGDQSGAIRSGKAQQVVADGDSLLAYISKIDGDTLPPSAASSLARQQEEEALLEIVDQMVSVIEIIQEGSDANVESIISMTQNIIESQDHLATAQGLLGRFSGGGIPEAIDMAKTSVWAFKMIFEKMYNALSNDEGEVQDGSHWDTENLITFTKNATTLYGFDAGGRTADKSYYTEVNFGGDTENYILPWVAADGTNTVEVAVNGDTQNVFFRSEDKSLTANARDGLVNLQSKKDNKPTEWQAYTTIDGQEKYVGKINVQPYEKQQYTLRIYAVNGQTLPDATALQTYLNTIYGQALIEWTVDIKDSYDLKYSAWDINPQDEAVQVGNSEELTAYTSEQKSIIKYFRDHHEKPKGKEVVLFWSPKASDPKVDGFMPLSKRYGFIFSPENNDATYRIVAHELGHGVFGLGHTWKTLKGIAKGTTANLMDYNGGLELWKWQWDIIQNPKAMVGFVNEDEDGMSSGDNDLLAILEQELKSKFKDTPVKIMVYAKRCETIVESVPESINIEKTIVAKVDKPGVRFILAITQDNVNIPSEEGAASTENAIDFLKEKLKLELDGNTQEALSLYTNFSNDNISQIACLNFKSNKKISDFDYCNSSITQEFVDGLVEASTKCFEEISSSFATKGSIEKHFENYNNAVPDLENPHETIKVKLSKDDADDFYTVFPNSLKEGDEEIILTYDQQTNSYKVEFSEQFKSTLKASKFNGQPIDDSTLDQLLEIYNNVVREVQINLCSGNQQDCSHEPLRALQVLNLNIKSIIKEGKMSEAMWRSKDALHNLATAKGERKLPSIPAGGVDFAIEEATSLITIAVFFGELITQEELRESLSKAYDDKGVIGIAEDMLKDELKNLKNDKEYFNYSATKITCEVVTLIFGVNTTTAKKTINGIKEQMSKLSDKDALIQYAYKFKNNTGVEAENFKKVLTKVGDKIADLNTWVKKIDKEYIPALMEDIVHNGKIVDVFKADDRLLEAWQDLVFLSETSANRVIRSDKFNLTSYLHAKELLAGNQEYIDKLKKIFTPDSNVGKHHALMQLGDATKENILGIIDKMGAITFPSFAQKLDISLPKGFADGFKDLIIERKDFRSKWQKLNEAKARGEVIDEKKLNEYAQKVRKASEAMGEKAAEKIVKQQYPKAEKITLHLGDNAKQGTFDQVYKVMDNGTEKYIFVEAKGGSSTLGTANTIEGVAQQGSRAYAEHILDEMRNKIKRKLDSGIGDTKKLKEAKKEIQNMEDALEDGFVDYLLVKQPLNADGTLDTTKVYKMDISTNKPN